MVAWQYLNYFKNKGTLLWCSFACLERCVILGFGMLDLVSSNCQFVSLPCLLPCVCVSGSLFLGLQRSRLSGFLLPGLLAPPPDPTDPSERACDLLLHHKQNENTEFNFHAFYWLFWTNNALVFTSIVRN